MVHWVTYDNDSDMEYLREYPDINLVKIDAQWLQQEMDSDIASPGTGTRSPYNLYFNKVLPLIHDGWVMILDDDDRLDPDALSVILPQIIYKTDLIVYQMRYENGMCLPNLNSFYKRPMLGNIGSPCVFFHALLGKTIRWDGWKCGDYRFIAKLWGITGNKKWIKRALVHLGTSTGNFGKRNDTTVEIAGGLVKKMKILRHYPPVILEVAPKAAPKPPIRVDGKKIKIAVLACGWNCEAYVEEFFRSIKSQIKGNYEYQIFCMDDASVDKTHMKLQKMASGDKSVVLRKNTINMGAAYSRWELMKLIPTDAVVFQVDMDDTISPRTFADIADMYIKDESLKVTIGNYRQGSTVNTQGIYPNDTIDKNLYFDHKNFLVPPLRTFRASLIGGLTEDMFKDENQKWLRWCTDVALMLGILGQCSSNEVMSIKTPYYNYRERSDKRSTIKRFGHSKKKTLNFLLKKFRHLHG